MDRLVDYVAKSLEALFDRPVILFGHSLGARVGFALARRVPSVAGLVASASVAAHLPPRKQRSVLSRDALIKELAELGGTPQQVLSDTELMDIFLPTIRADFSLLERGVAPAGATVSCPILALASRADREVAFEDAQAWASCTTSHFEWVEMSGGHFYMQANREAILAGIRRAAARWAPHSARID
jgi:surfactin synthase thioesterase subunit